MAHDYVSTACLHEEDDPALHGVCRQTCKYCDAPCQCQRHLSGEVPAPASWVDQARNVARELLALLTGEAAYSQEMLLHQVESDPSLFWLRGEQPPGEWRPGD